MTIYWIYIAICLLSAGVALATTPLVRLIALKFKKLDAPSERKVHCQPMVRLGGVAIFGATLLSLFCIWIAGALGEFTSETLSTVLLLLLGGSSFFCVGFADDLFDLSAINRLCMQAAIASILWGLGIQINALTLPGLSSPIALGWLSLPITVFWLAGVVNAINWIDGLDGLATGVSSIITAVLVVLGIAMAQPVPAIIGCALLGSLLGFLYHNYNPAKIFMGDGGAYFIGFTLASLCIIGPQHINSPFATVLPLVILAVPLGDMATVILVRLYRKQSPFSADNLHLHHRLMSLDLTHQSTVWVVYVLTLATGSLAFVLVGLAGWLTLSIGLTVLLCFVIWQLKVAVIASFEVSNVVVSKGLWYSKNP